jgi:hypothetical protein
MDFVGIAYRIMIEPSLYPILIYMKKYISVNSKLLKT